MTGAFYVRVFMYMHMYFSGHFLYIYVHIRHSYVENWHCTAGDINEETPLTVLTFQERARTGF